ncbi:MAG: AAA family ATPase [Bacteroidota bacterium]
MGGDKNLFARNLAKEIDADLVILSTAVPIKELEGERLSSKGPGSLGAIGEALLKKKPGRGLIILFDEVDNSVKSKQRALRELFLKLLDPANNGRYHLKYLGGERKKAAEVALPLVIILNSNDSIAELSPPLANRCDNKRFGGYSWEQKKDMVLGEVYDLLRRVYCDSVGISPDMLTKEDYQRISDLIDKMAEEDKQKPSDKKDPGMRKVDAKVKRMLELIKIDKVENESPEEEEEESI